MSVDIDIIPLASSRVPWATVRNGWIHRLGELAGALLGDDPVMRRLGERTVVHDSEPLAPVLTCYFELAVENTLSLTILPNEPEHSELEYLEDYGRNLSPTETGELARQWGRAGYSFGLSSGGGRSRDEPRMLVALACALADASDGRVILMNDGLFTLGIGIYTPDQFERAEWVR